MLRLSNLKMPLGFSDDDLVPAVSRLLGVSASRIARCALSRKSIDARRKDAVCFVVSVDVALTRAEDERRIAARLGPGCTPPEPYHALRLPHPPAPGTPRPIVVGLGPAGLFAALTLAEGGAPPLVLERGRDVDARAEDVARYFSQGEAGFDPSSNVQFGEGGAGAFSDGKLHTGIKDPRGDHVLRTFARFGAPRQILISAKPHIGTDKLPAVVRAMRAHIIALGGEVRFGARMTDIVSSSGCVVAVRWEDAQGSHECPASHIVLATGHSARDTLTLLHERGFSLQRKPFSLGARIEHPQEAIDRAQYGSFAGHRALGAADYKLSVHLQGGRSVYTFCMCPGGTVIAAASEPQSVVTNGMSTYARDGENANSALLVGVDPADFPGEHPLSGMYWQRELERRAFELGGCTGRAPCQRVGDLLAGRASGGFGAVRPSYRPGVEPCDLALLLPAFVVQAMREALPLFGRRLHGFDMADALLTAPETRSSSPVRIPRGETLQSVDLQGLYPCGEGAGYAGGITSAAVDGVRCAEAILSVLGE